MKAGSVHGSRGRQHAFNNKQGMSRRGAGCTPGGAAAPAGTARPASRSWAATQARGWRGTAPCGAP